MDFIRRGVSRRRCSTVSTAFISTRVRANSRPRGPIRGISQPTIGRSSVEKHGAALVAQVVKLLENTLEDVPSLEQLAVSFGVSRRHLTRVFADVTGDTILGHVQKLRMERSKQLLRHTRLSIIEIALNVGFQSASHFAEIFRRATDMSPDQWRRSA